MLLPGGLCALAAVLLLVLAYLYLVGVSIYYRCKLEKELYAKNSVARA